MRVASTNIVSVILQLTGAEAAVMLLRPFNQPDLAAAFTTIDFAPRNVRYQDGQLTIDYVYSSHHDNSSAADIAEMCRLAIESKLSQAFGA